MLPDNVLKMYLLELTKLLLVKANFYDQIGAYVRYAAQYNPSLQDLLDMNSDSAGLIEASAIKPLTWTGGIAVLGTLFNKLCTSEINIIGNPLINASAKEIEDFVCTLFVYEDGNPFEKESVARYLSFDKLASVIKWI